VAATAPDVAVQVGALARERVGGLQGIAAEPPQPRAVVVGHRLDATSSELRRFLDRNQITFEWLTPDVTDAAERWSGALPSDGDYPAVRVPDGTTLVRHAFARSPSSSASRPGRPRASTTRSSSAPGRRGSPPPSTG